MPKTRSHFNAFCHRAPQWEVRAPEGRLGLPPSAPEAQLAAWAMLGFIALLAHEFALGGEAFTRGLLGIG